MLAMLVMLSVAGTQLYFIVRCRNRLFVSNNTFVFNGLNISDVTDNLTSDKVTDSLCLRWHHSGIFVTGNCQSDREM